MAGIVFLIDTIAFVVVVFWAFRAEDRSRERRRGLLDMIGEAIASAAPSAPRWAGRSRMTDAPRKRHVTGWRRSLGRVRADVE